MKKRSTILLVDDEANFLRSLQDSLELEGYRIFTAGNGNEALRLLEKQSIQVVISDIRMPGMDGMELLAQIHRRWPAISVFLLTGYGSIQDAVQSIKMGAENYILKPVNVQDLIGNIRRSLELRSHSSWLKSDSEPEIPVLIGESEAMKEIRALIRKIAGTDLSVLITGASGTGKELAANAIYRLSKRKNHPFLKINCAALPEHLLESELFGYEPGAFTDARKLKRGKLELAHGGTLFLDEIGDMPLTMQAKLLRVLEEKKVERLGGNRPIPTDFRLISATNQDLQHLIEKGRFRQDLYFRLNMMQLKLPTLHEISEDIPDLSYYFLKNYCQEHNLEIPQFDPETMECLRHYHWPGNVRELRNVIHRAAVLCNNGRITPDDLPFPPPQSLPSKNRSERRLLPLEELEKEHIARVLKLTGGNKLKTASILNIHRDTLYRKIKKYGIKV